MSGLRRMVWGFTAAMSLAWWTGTAAADGSLEQKLAAALRDAKTSEAAARNGKEASAFCANCHGDDGNSRYPEVPNLAGQNPRYLLEQVRKFGDGERLNEFMQKLIRLLSDEDKVNIAVYYARLPVRPHGGGNAALVEKGREWYAKICFRCHGGEGHGNEKIARISGQQTGYLALTLKRYRDRGGERIDAQMAANTSVLNDNDIKAVVEYVAQMK